MISHRLSTAIWEITLKCNLKCLHCGSSAGEARNAELTTKEAITLCKDLAELDCENVCLMGGEPFLRKDWFEISKEIKDLNMEVSFVSNGTTINTETVRKLAKTEPIVVGISIDGTEQIHDSIRGFQGSYKKAIDSLNLLKSMGIQATVITTVGKTNFRELPKIRELLLGMDAGWQIQVGVPMGRFRQEHLISEKEFYALGLFVTNCRATSTFDSIPVVGAHCLGYYSRFLTSGSWDGCTAGITSLGIASNGDVMGCLSLRDKQFVEGNVKEIGVKEIWNDKNRFCYTRRFEAKQLGTNCERCKFGRACKGGCGSMSYYLSGSLHNDPYCFRRIENASNL
jgi:radical SAM protein with 4Fe4S-binding SPASM domain